MRNAGFQALVTGATLALLLKSLPVMAVSVNVGASTLNGNSVADHSATGLLSFDPSFANDLPMQLVIVIDNADYLASTCGPTAICVDWNGFYTNLSGVAWQSFMLSVTNPVSINFVGDITPDFGSVNSVSQVNAQTARIVFDTPPGEISGFELGGLDLGTSNWRLDITDVLPTATLGLTLTPTQVVPLPAAVWLFSGGLAALGSVRRRK